jgi:hypothetical protein
MRRRERHTHVMRRGVLLVLVAGLAALTAGGLSLSASGREGASAQPRAGARPAAELPPLPKMRPKVVEPVAGGSSQAPVTDPGLTDIGPKPDAPASAGARRRSSPGTPDITKATALANGVALPPLEAPEEVKQIIEVARQWLRLLRLGLVRSRRRRVARRAARLRAADELGRAGPRQVGDDLVEPGPRVHGGGRDPVRHLRPAGRRVTLAEHDAVHERVRRSPSRRPLIGIRVYTP